MTTLTSLRHSHTEGLNDVVWLCNSDEGKVATASDDKTIKIWDVETVSE